MTRKNYDVIVVNMKMFPKFLKLSKTKKGGGATIYINKDIIQKMKWKPGEEILSVLYDAEKAEVILKAFSE